MTPIINIVIALIVAGFVVWAARKIVAILPLDAFLKTVADLLITILVVAIVIFYVVVPLLQMLASHAPFHF